MNEDEGTRGGDAPGAVEGAGVPSHSDRADSPGPDRRRVVLLAVLGGLVGLFVGPLLAGLVYALLRRFFGSEWDFDRQREWGKTSLYLGLVAGPPLCAFLLYRSARRGGPAPSPASGTDRAVVGTPLTWAHGALILAGVGILFLVAQSRPEHSLLSRYETTAIASLRNLARCQESFRSKGTVDCDGDGIGEYGTFLELTGTIPVRTAFFPGTPAGSDFSRQGKAADPGALPQNLGTVDARGMATWSGYLFILYLPGDSGSAGFVHETGPAATPGLSGRIGVDRAETCWRAYAWPVSRGKTGNRCFCIDQTGDVLQSADEVAKWDGATRIMAPESAFLGGGITGAMAIGTRGRDGDVWKVVN